MIYIGAYAIVRVPIRKKCLNVGWCESCQKYIQNYDNYCRTCGTKSVKKEECEDVSTTLNDLIDEGKLEEDKYHSIYYSIDTSVDEPFSLEPLLLVGNQDGGETRIDIDHDYGTLPWHIITNISQEDITRCTANFIRLYFKELSAIGETTVHFGVLRDVEV